MFVFCLQACICNKCVLGVCRCQRRALDLQELQLKWLKTNMCMLGIYMDPLLEQQVLRILNHLPTSLIFSKPCSLPCYTQST